ncbi:MAG: family 78 glycoside hydrolase catalytic domain [Chitinophagaceae bacterium]|nr:family 78 glycoside hydrolase catalytic domain [Chitinophagaceae bacterium]
MRVKKKFSMTFWVAGIMCLNILSTYGQPGLRAVNLRVEYKTNTFVDVEKPRFSWELQSAVNNQVQIAWQILVASSVALLNDEKADVWNSGKVSSDMNYQVEYGGKPLSSDKNYYWKVRSWDAQGNPGAWSQPAYWHTALMQQSDWKASWIGFDVNNLSTDKTYHLPPSPYLRKESSVTGAVKKATLYVTALGLYEFYINGKRIGEDYFAPGWTDYNKRVYYNAYDVTGHLKAGKNALSASLATGWYAGYLGYALLVGSPTKYAFYGKVPMLKAQLEIEYANGKKETIVTDQSWKASTGGIREADILNGETYNGGLEPVGWKNAGYNEAGWQPVQVFADKASLPLRLYPGNPVKIIEEITPVSIDEREKGRYVVNLGQNFSGVIKLTVKGKIGDSVIIKYGEMLHTNGEVMTENLRRARGTDTYILKGDPKGETWMPRFTYHGFQYVEIRGLRNKPSVNDIKGIVMSSATPQTGSFVTDNAVLNQLYKNIIWTQRSNYFDIPTDCPQRDERLGWTGDAQVYMRSAAYNNDIAAFHTKWITDLNDAQWANGTYPVYAPIPSENGVATIRASDTYSPGWAEAGIVCPYNIYKMYGDTRVIEESWPYMVKYMKFLEDRSKGNYFFAEASFEDINPKGGFGDWLSVGKKTPPDMLATMYYNYCALLMAEMAKAIHNEKDAAWYAEVSEKIKAGFAKHYIDADGRLKTNAAAYGNGQGYVDGSLGFSGHTQTAYANAIYMQILSGENFEKAGVYLRDLVKENNNQLATGFLGFKPLLPALSASGNSNVAYTLIKDTAYPSLGFEVVNGSTTIWERWDSYIKGEGFRHNASMNSFNHYAFGAVCEWMFQNMAGIQPVDAGFKTFIIKPEVDPAGIGSVTAEYKSINGLIRSSWKKSGDQIKQEVTIPVNTRATVFVKGNPEHIAVSGKKLQSINDIRVEGFANGYTKLQLGSGSYQFIANTQ